MADRAEAEAEVVRLRVVSGGLVDVPAWEKHHRGKNWAAVIGADPRMPGGLSRRFLEYARGDFYYSLGDLSLFDAVEFAGDYVSWSGSVTSNRWFGVVVTKTEDFVELRRCQRGIDAVLLSSELRQSTEERKAALRRELDHCRSRAAEIEAELG